MSYIDGFVIPVPISRKEAYFEMARKGAPIFKRHGALKVVETWGTDVPEGKITSFPMAVKCQPDEAVVFSWIVWPSKDVRDAGMKKAMEDPEMEALGTDMPFDGKRMIFGGFEVLVES